MTLTRRTWMLGAAGALAGAAAEPRVSMVEAEGEGRQYWPRWRGPSGQGLVPGSG